MSRLQLTGTVVGAVIARLMLAGAAQAAAQTAEPDLAKANALLQSGQASEARVLFAQALEADPGSVGAHLGLARAYYALGEYSRARIEFETVLRFQNLPRDQQSQTYTYDQVAEAYAAGRRWRPFYYAETGAGVYRENASSSTELFGGAGDYDSFLPVRVGGGFNASLTERYSFNGTLDYRFRSYDNSNRRNDSDLRWNFNVARPVDADNLRFGMRGRVSYRGDSDQVTIGGELRKRRYPGSPLRSRTRDIAELTTSWNHSLPNGRTSLTLGGLLAQEWAAQDRPEGNASFWGVNGELDHSFTDAVDGFFWWSYISESFDDERPDFTTDPDLLRVRNDDLWNCGGGLVWGFAPGWSLRPTFEYNWEDSNIASLAYSSTELWLTVRKSF